MRTVTLLCKSSLYQLNNKCISQHFYIKDLHMLIMNYLDLLRNATVILLHACMLVYMCLFTHTYRHRFL